MASKETKLPSCGGWDFTPEGAIVHRAEQTAVVADLHLGYEWTRGAAGDCVFAQSLDETLSRLATVLGRFTVSNLVIAGDLRESARPCAFTARDVERLHSWLADRGISLQVLEGNHDVGSSRAAKRSPRVVSHLLETCVVAGWTIGHGHRPIKGAARISGHFHPVFRWQGIVAPCFLACSNRIVLPAFSRDAAGCNVLSAAIPKDWLAGCLHCLVGTGNEVLDFGPLANLRRKLSGGAS